MEILGPIHGALFLAYVALAFVLSSHAEWSVRTTALVLAAAVVPAGGFAVDRWMTRQSFETSG